MINTASFHFRQDKDFPHDVDVKNDENDSKYIIVTLGGLSKADYDLCLFLSPEQALQLGENIVHVVKNCEPEGTRFCQSCGDMLTGENKGAFGTHCRYCDEQVHEQKESEAV